MARKNFNDDRNRRGKNRYSDEETNGSIQVGLFNYNEWIPRDMDLSVMKSPSRRRSNNKDREERRYGHFEDEVVEEEALEPLSAIKSPRKKEIKIADPDLEIVAKGKVKPQKLLEEEEEVPDLDEEEEK